MDMIETRIKRVIMLLPILVALMAQPAMAQERKGPAPQAPTTAGLFGLPPDIGKEYRFLGQEFPIQRHDIKSRIIWQINFLLYDARSVMTEWVLEKSRFNWIYRETFSKAGVPEDFIWLAPVLGGATKGSRPQSVGVWMLDKPCSRAEGVEMNEDSFMDERLDVQLSTKCFAQRLAAIHKDYGMDWLMTAVAYLITPKNAKEIVEKYGTSNPWDIPLPDNIEDLLDRWIALKIIYTHRLFYGLNFKDPAPVIFDQLSDVKLSRDLPVAEIARIIGVSPRLILELNPKIKTNPGVFPAKADGRQLNHTIAAPSGTGAQLLKKLQESGYIEDARKL